MLPSSAEKDCAIKIEYKAVACDINHTIHFTSGLKLAKRLGYQEEIMSQIPDSAIRPFAGVGNSCTRNFQGTPPLMD